MSVHINGLEVTADIKDLSDPRRILEAEQRFANNNLGGSILVLGNDGCELVTFISEDTSSEDLRRISEDEVLRALGNRAL